MGVETLRTQYILTKSTSAELSGYIGTGAEMYYGHLSLDLKSVGVPTYSFNWADRE